MASGATADPAADPAADSAGDPHPPLACLRLRHAIGLDQPRHWYHVGCVVHAAAELGLFHRLQTLRLGNDLTGASELPGLRDADGASAFWQGLGQPFYGADPLQAAQRFGPAWSVWHGLLLQAGLRARGHVSIDQGGPVLAVPLAVLRGGCAQHGTAASPASP